MQAKTVLRKLYSQFARLGQSEDRCSVLIKAVGVMDRICVSLIRRRDMSLLPPDYAKLWDKVSKMRARALSTTFVGEKETSLRMCLKFQERIVGKYNPPPFADFVARADKLEARNNKATVRKASKPSAPRAPKGAGGAPTILDSKFKPGSSAWLAREILLANPSIMLVDAISEFTFRMNSRGMKSSNPKSRVMMVASNLIHHGQLRKTGRGPSTLYTRV
jgi:hypothetical protein